jgi:periplasmic divalent cation tolerance protein
MSRSHEITLIYATVPTLAVGREIAGILIAERLIACANLLPGMISVYRWNDVVEEAEEAVLICKTSRDRVNEARDRLAGLHPYEVPAILEIADVGGHYPFLVWVAGETAQESPLPSLPDVTPTENGPE